MKLFLDTADTPAIARALETGLLDGITTNPTNLSKEGGDPRKKILEICHLLKDRDVSVEVTERDPQAVYKQANEIAALAKNVVVKVPCFPEYFPVIKRLVQEGKRLNITLVFSLIQGLLMAKLGVAYISPFVGRLGEIEGDGIGLLHELRDMIDLYQFSTLILAASLRSIEQVHQTVMAGADVATVPVKIFEQLGQHPLTTSGMATFFADWQKLGITKFP